MTNKTWVWLGVVFGVVFFVIGVVYITHTAGMLPVFFPGHQAGSTHRHAKHGIASFIAGIACFIVAWFASAPKKA